MGGIFRLEQRKIQRGATISELTLLNLALGTPQIFLAAHSLFSPPQGGELGFGQGSISRTDFCHFEELFVTSTRCWGCDTWGGTQGTHSRDSSP